MVVVGIGGLGHVGIPIAKAMGAEVVALTGSADKVELARQLGADHVLQSGSEVGPALMALGGANLVVDTAPAPEPMLTLMGGLMPRTTIVSLGVDLAPVPIPKAALAMAQLRLIGSLGATHQQFDELLTLAAEHDIRPMVEQYPLSAVNAVQERLADNEVRFRAVMTPGS